MHHDTASGEQRQRITAGADLLESDGAAPALEIAVGVAATTPPPDAPLDSVLEAISKVALEHSRLAPGFYCVP